MEAPKPTCQDCGKALRKGSGAKAHKTCSKRRPMDFKTATELARFLGRDTHEIYRLDK